MATNYNELLEQLKDAYANLLIVQYHDKPLAIATIKANIEILLSNMLLWKIRDCWDIDDTTLCVGTQLDIIGKWVGVDRYYQGQSFGDSLHLSFVDWDEVAEPTANQGGLRDWNLDRPEDGDFLTFNNVISITNALNDDDFRLLIKLKIIKNNTIMSCKNIDDAIFKLFANDVFTTWRECSSCDYLSFYNWNDINEPNNEQKGFQNWNNITDDDGYFLTYEDISGVMVTLYNYSKQYNAIMELAKKKNCLPVPTGCKIKLQEIA